MHETSIVNGIFRTLEQEFEEEKLNKMTGIYYGWLDKYGRLFFNKMAGIYHGWHDKWLFNLVGINATSN